MKNHYERAKPNRVSSAERLSDHYFHAYFLVGRQIYSRVPNNRPTPIVNFWNFFPGS